MPASSSRSRRRDAILGAAADRFVREGYAETTVDTIAAAAGVARATVFNHFEGKRALLIALYDRQQERLLQRLAERAPGAPWERQLAWFFRSGEAELRVDDALTWILHAEVLHDPLLLAHDEVRGALVRRILEQIVQDGQRQGRLAAGLRPGAIAGLFMDCWTAAVGRWVAQGRQTPLAAEVLRRVRLIVRGVGAGPGPAPRRS
mgnify:FL=1